MCAISEAGGNLNGVETNVWLCEPLAFDLQFISGHIKGGEGFNTLHSDSSLHEEG